MNYSTEWVYLISNFGFPIVMTAYLLIRFEKKIDRLGNVLETLRDAINEKSKK